MTRQLVAGDIRQQMTGLEWEVFRLGVDRRNWHDELDESAFVYQIVVPREDWGVVGPSTWVPVRSVHDRGLPDEQDWRSRRTSAQDFSEQIASRDVTCSSSECCKQSP